MTSSFATNRASNRAQPNEQRSGHPRCSVALKKSILLSFLRCTAGLGWGLTDQTPFKESLQTSRHDTLTKPTKHQTKQPTSTTRKKTARPKCTIIHVYDRHQHQQRRHDGQNTSLPANETQTRKLSHNSKKYNTWRRLRGDWRGSCHDQRRSRGDPSPTDGEPSRASIPSTSLRTPHRAPPSPLPRRTRVSGNGTREYAKCDKQHHEQVLFFR